MSTIPIRKSPNATFGVKIGEEANGWMYTVDFVFHFRQKKNVCHAWEICSIPFQVSFHAPNLLGFRKRYLQE